MKTALFDYQLPGELIALHPPARRDGGRLLVIEPATGQQSHSSLADLPGLLPAGSLLVVNDTRVIPARLHARRPSGGKVEVLLVRSLGATGTGCSWSALARSNRPLRSGDRIDLYGIAGRVERWGSDGDIRVHFEASDDIVRRLIDEHGQVPLPPYIKRDPVREDRARYQTVYAQHEGSVAAPTAGLHFTAELLERIRDSGIEVVFVTLHVGPGTFRPITGECLAEHRMSAEQFSIGEVTAGALLLAREQSRPVIAVGTTVVRCLEGAYLEHGRIVATQGFTELFITPGFEFKVVDGLLTNFHLPRSTLLCLVSALAGRELVLEAYAEAVRQRYRFYSYGDAMLILTAGS